MKIALLFFVCCIFFVFQRLILIFLIVGIRNDKHRFDDFSDVFRRQFGSRHAESKVWDLLAIGVDGDMELF